MKMVTKLINPFKYIAGWKSLVIGVLILLTTALTGNLSNTQFPDLISVKTSSDFSLQYSIIQNFLNWIGISFILYLVSITTSPSKIRIIDVFGTQALSRFPYLIVSFIGFSSSIDKFGKFLLWKFLQQGEVVEINLSTIVIAILLIISTLFLTIWMVVLMFNAFKVSSNLKGYKLIVSFIASFIISIILIGLISNRLIQNF